jgi:hypothetical protein
LNAVLARLRGDRRLALILGTILLAAVLMVAFSLTRPEPLSFTPTTTAIPLPDSAGFRITIDASAPDQWRFYSLRQHRQLDRPAPGEWDLALRRFGIATNGGPGFAGAGSAGILDPADQPPALQQTSADTSKSGFGKWYNYSFTSHLLTPKPLRYRVLAADGTPFEVRILSYYCPGANPGCITLEYTPTAGRTAGRTAGQSGNRAIGQ